MTLQGSGHIKNVELTFLLSMLVCSSETRWTFEIMNTEFWPSIDQLPDYGKKKKQKENTNRRSILSNLFSSS